MFILDLNKPANLLYRLQLGVMSLASFDSSSLYSTEHGTTQRRSDGMLVVSLGRWRWALSSANVRALHETIQPLAHQVYRCNCDCRWQLRLPGHDAVILTTDEVLQLHSLLDGTTTMLELDVLLEDASIARPAVRE